MRGCVHAAIYLAAVDSRKTWLTTAGGAKLGLPRAVETIGSIDANHMQMSRYSSRDNQGYRAAAGIFERVRVQGAGKAANTP